MKAVANVSTIGANPARVVAAQRRLISAARGRFDVMILDTAPLLSANDAVELVGSTDLVLIVARAEQSTSTDAARAMEMLERVNAPVAGVAFIGGSERAELVLLQLLPARRGAARRSSPSQRCVASDGGVHQREGLVGRRRHRG